jgi:hypothetical protein
MDMDRRVPSIIRQHLRVDRKEELPSLTNSYKSFELYTDVSRVQQGTCISQGVKSVAFFSNYDKCPL